jgi:hypothetical protein
MIESHPKFLKQGGDTRSQKWCLAHRKPAVRPEGLVKPSTDSALDAGAFGKSRQEFHSSLVSFLVQSSGFEQLHDAVERHAVSRESGK